MSQHDPPYKTFIIILQTSVAPLENKEVMTDFVAEPIPIERSQTRTLIRRDDVFDEDDDDRDVVTVDREKDDSVERRPKDFVDQIRSTPNIIERPKDHHHVDQTGLDEGSSESTAPSRATTDPASTLRDSGYSDITGGSRNFTPGL